MSLYMNENENVYKSHEQLHAPNQQMFVRSHMSEVLEEHNNVQQSIMKSIRRLNSQMAGQGLKQQQNWNSITDQLQSLEEDSMNHKTMEQNVLDKLQILEENQQSISIQIKEEGISKQQITSHLTEMKKSQQVLQEMMDAMQITNEKYHAKVEEQNQLQQVVMQTLKEKDVEVENINERIESQEALLEKVVRQMDHFRGVMYERTNYLAKKLESTVAYMLNKLTGDNDDRQEEVQETKEKQNV
ncbi:hypothetical protein [Oceanobacillus iheyensis HTE831]|uniref:Uncharacterized protein n=1 Tax=Oceanobacillus iheyensis (strain DSM 14371 / CIP 107618 / JCM 11309 / KCTC 3954 / HTE831) TaxID=221109 RepID=Q8ELR8_OCEIH|nr:hypothetical protein [Oceanobacillus iheyensis]BAC15106.1 hypothetical protein [Oceanobacillus iheyensis HTE831]